MILLGAHWWQFGHDVGGASGSSMLLEWPNMFGGFDGKRGFSIYSC